MRNLISAEIMKSRTRWLPYLLLFILFIGAAIQVWLFGLVAYYDERSQYGGFPPGLISFQWPYSLVAILDSGQYWGPVFIAFFTASAVATDFGWGTVRLTIARGVTRPRYLASKLLGVMLICTAGMLVALALAVVFSLLATWIVGADIPSVVPDSETWEGDFVPGGQPIPGGPSAAEMPAMIGRAALAILPYGMLAFMLSVIARSTAVGATGVLVYKLIESAAIGIFGALGGIWAQFQNLFIGHYAASVMAPNRSGDIGYNSIAFRELPDPSEVPDPWLSAAMLVVFTLVFAAVSFWAFTHRDLNSRE